MDLPLPRCSAWSDLELVEVLGVIWPWMSRRELDELFAAGRVRAVGRPVSPRARLSSVSEWTLRTEQPFAPRGELGAIAGVEILDETEDVVVVSKPSGVPVVPDRAAARPSVLEMMVGRELDLRAGLPPEDWRRPRVVHRIDRLTSGLVILARSPRAERVMAAAFEERRVDKTYLALVVGEPSAARVTVDAPLGPGRKGRMRVRPDGKPATTAFEVLERFRGSTLVAAHPLTGRTHQIRVHALAWGHPLAIDPLYRTRQFEAWPKPPSIDRLTLHATRYAVPLPGGVLGVWSAPPPEDLAEAVEELRRQAARDRAGRPALSPQRSSSPRR